MVILLSAVNQFVIVVLGGNPFAFCIKQFKL